MAFPRVFYMISRRNRVRTAEKRGRTMRRLLAISFLAALSALIAAGGGAFAADKIRVGKPEAKPFQFAPVEIGIGAGIFAKYGIEPQSIGFGGASRMHQAI